jgi:4-amino-4-deoxy-L-arabinose transferase-like glycosyltransferase
MLIKYLYNYKYLLIILAIGTFLRFWNLSNNPPSLNWDEVSHGYNAYSILKTGKDEWGTKFPMIFRAYGDYKLPGYIYLTVISEFLFGLTPFAVRFVSAIAGIGTVFFTFLLCLEIFSNKKYGSPSTVHRPLATIAALLVASEPWSFFLSRGAFEANLALFFFVAGIYFFFKYLNSYASYFLLTASILLGLTVWTYNSYRIFTPLMLIIIVLIYKKEMLKNFIRSRLSHIFSLFTLLLFILPMFYQLLTSVGQARYSWVQILDQGTIARIDEMRNAGGSRLIHNKITYFSCNFGKNYISHFSPKFLYFKGGSNYQFSIPREGILYLLDLPFLIVGIILVFTRSLKKDKISLFLLSWLILAPVPSSLTREAPHVLRLITILPMPMISSAIGLQRFIGYFAKQKSTFYILYSIFLFLLAISTVGYLKTYFIDYKFNYAQSWQYGYKDASDYIKANYTNYDKIIITKKYGEPHEFLLFNLKWDPNKFREDPDLIRFYKSNWYWVDRFDKFYFVNDWEISEKSELNLARSIPDKEAFKLESGEIVDCHGTSSSCLLITSPGNSPDGWQKVETLNFLDGKSAFEIYEN